MSTEKLLFCPRHTQESAVQWLRAWIYERNLATYGCASSVASSAASDGGSIAASHQTRSGAGHRAHPDFPSPHYSPLLSRSV